MTILASENLISKGKTRNKGNTRKYFKEEITGIRVECDDMSNSVHYVYIYIVYFYKKFRTSNN